MFRDVEEDENMITEKMETKCQIAIKQIEKIHKLHRCKCVTLYYYYYHTNGCNDHLSGGRLWWLVARTHLSGGRLWWLVARTHLSGGRLWWLVARTHLSGGRHWWLVARTHLSGGRLWWLVARTHLSGGRLWWLVARTPVAQTPGSSDADNERPSHQFEEPTNHAEWKYSIF